MRRALLIVSVLAAVPLCAFAIGRTATSGAQESTPASVDGFIDAWRVTVSPPQGQPHPGLMTFSADGTLLVAVLVASDTGMPIGTLTLRGMATLESGNQSLTSTYTVDFADVTGQVLSTGQGSLQGTRIVVEPPGTPTVASPIAGTPAP
jgi:hypothetical protein